MRWDDTVRNEGRETFSAWPIIFNQEDPAGFTFTKESDLQPPFNDLFIVLSFYVTEDKHTYKKIDAQIASVLSYRLNDKGLWVRGAFVQFDDTSPFQKMVEKLKAAIRAGYIGLTYVSIQEKAIIEPNGLVRKLPIIAFNFYEKAATDVPPEIADAGTRSLR